MDEKQASHEMGASGLQRLISPRILSDFTIGLSDGLTVPFALTAGLSALGDTRVVIFGGLAELVAGAISMGVAGYLGAKGERYVTSGHSYNPAYIIFILRSASALAVLLRSPLVLCIMFMFETWSL